MTIVQWSGDPGFIDQIGPSWGPDGANPVLTRILTDNAPPSEKNCCRITNSVNDAGLYCETLTLQVNTQYTFSLYMKNNGGNTGITLNCRDSTTFTSVGYVDVTITSEWARYTLTFTTDATHTGYILYVMGASGTGFNFYVDAFQVETGASATAYDQTGAGTPDPGSLTLDSALPDADITTTGWSTAPLYSKLNDASDATVITATAS